MNTEFDQWESISIGRWGACEYCGDNESEERCECCYDGHFSWGGCERCKGGGGTVYECIGWMPGAREGDFGDEFKGEVELCGDCIYELEYGEEQSAGG